MTCPKCGGYSSAPVGYTCGSPGCSFRANANALDAQVRANSVRQQEASRQADERHTGWDESRRQAESEFNARWGYPHTSQAQGNIPDGASNIGDSFAIAVFIIAFFSIFQSDALARLGRFGEMLCAVLWRTTATLATFAAALATAAEAHPSSNMYINSVTLIVIVAMIWVAPTIMRGDQRAIRAAANGSFFRPLLTASIYAIGAAWAFLVCATVFGVVANGWMFFFAAIAIAWMVVGKMRNKNKPLLEPFGTCNTTR